MKDMMMFMDIQLKMMWLHHPAFVSLETFVFFCLLSPISKNPHISPRFAEHFLYDRNQEHQMSAYIQSDIPEEDEPLDEVNNTLNIN